MVNNEMPKFDYIINNCWCIYFTSSCSEWWNFAITSTLHGIRERNKRRSPQFISQRIQKNQRYIGAYTTILEGSTPDSESKVCYYCTGGVVQDLNLKPCRKWRLRLQLRLDQHVCKCWRIRRRADLAITVAEVVISYTARFSHDWG